MNALEMNFDQFVNWATGYTLSELGAGTRLKEIMHTIVDHAIRNEVFGGGKPDKKKGK